MLSVRCLRPANPWKYYERKVTGLIRLPLHPVRADDWCDAHGCLVKRYPATATKIPPPALIMNDESKAARTFYKAGLNAYVAEPGSVLAIGGLSMFIASDGTQCFDKLHEVRKHPNRTLITCLTEGRAGSPEAATFFMSDKRIPKAVLLLDDIEFNYYHWMIETVTRLAHIIDNPRYDDYPILITKGIHPNMRRAVELVCPGRPILSIPKLYAIHVEDAVYPSAINECHEYRQVKFVSSSIRFDIPVVREIAETIKGSHIGSPHYAQLKKIFLSRKGYCRGLLNADEVEFYLRRKGFACIDPGILTLDEQISLFSHAECIVGSSGAAMTNLMFCGKGTVACTLHPKGTYSAARLWQYMANVSEARFCCIFGDTQADVPETDILYYARPDKIDLRYIAEMLSAMNC